MLAMTFSRLASFPGLFPGFNFTARAWAIFYLTLHPILLASRGFNDVGKTKS